MQYKIYKQIDTIFKLLSFVKNRKITYDSRCLDAWTVFVDTLGKFEFPRCCSSRSFSSDLKFLLKLLFFYAYIIR